jgi:hypothetical protein
MTIPTQPEQSDADRFATRPPQRKREVLNVTDNKLAKLRKATIKAAMTALAERLPGEAVRAMEDGVKEQHEADDRTLDPETVAEQFAAKEQELTNAITIRALIAQAGLNHG